MLKEYLKKISKIKLDLINTKIINGVFLNVSIFGEKIPKDLVKYKISFLKNMLEKTDFLIKIILELGNEKDLDKKNRKIIEKEIFVKLKEIEFLKNVYDIEANKLDKNYKIIEELENYDYYNEIFYGFTKEHLKQKINISENKDFEIFVSKEELIKLLEFSKTKLPKLRWIFGNFVGLAHDSGFIKIPNSKKYSIKLIIAIFFHEITHFIRYINGKNNLGFSYNFSDYETLEEGIALYNEYFYGNKIINYGKYEPHYDKCYQIILKDISKKEKLEELYNVLKNKGFIKKDMLKYYDRFFRYSKIGGKNLFLKELIYTNAYNNVSNNLLKDSKNYEKIMAGKIGLYGYNANFLNNDKNIDSKIFFDIMVGKIKKLFN